MDLDTEAVLAALFDLGSSVSWGTPARTFAASGRRYRDFSAVPAQPWFGQIAHDETWTQKTGMPSLVEMDVKWVAYHNVGVDPDATPNTETNLIKDALIGALAGDDPDGRQTLGGLATHVFVNGRLFRDDGDVDGQAVLVIPIRVQVPMS